MSGSEQIIDVNGFSETSHSARIQSFQRSPDMEEMRISFLAVPFFCGVSVNVWLRAHAGCLVWAADFGACEIIKQS